MIIDGIRKYLKDCPLLEGGKIKVDFLPSEANKYSIEPVPVNPLIRKYVDGSCQKQYVFEFASRKSIDANDLTNLENNGFYEQLEAWINENNRAKKFPQLGDGKYAQRVECLTHGYNYGQDGKTGRYQIQCRVIYLEY
ncbi:MAG: hypothetical protein IJ300_06935 [Clostridia bacterium]|nr:hypothetical protein [Clostridia bacterium]